LDQAVEALLDLLRPGDVLLTLGAGDGYKVGEMVLFELGRQAASAEDMRVRGQADH
jgi:UDP-N-acetylmuramate--alanine ligase